MRRFPKIAREAQTKCISCNAPLTQTVSKNFVCVVCGKSAISTRRQGMAPTN